jgi:hypothetical protein
MEVIISVECPKKTHENSLPSCCSSIMGEEEKPCPVNCRGCNHAKKIAEEREECTGEEPTWERVLLHLYDTSRKQAAAAPAGSAGHNREDEGPGSGSPSLDDMFRVTTFI